MDDCQEMTTPPRLPRAKSRALDPDTSHRAAIKVEREGTAGTQRRRCMEQVRRSPGQTAAEIAAALGLERHVPSRRLPELREAGLVANGPSRVCSVMGTPSMTWVLAPPATAPVFVQKELL